MSRERPRLCIRTTAAPVSCHDARQIRVVLQHADVIDDRRPAFDGLARDDRLVGVHRDECAGGRQPLDDRQHAPQLFLQRNRFGPWTRRLAADVEDIRPLLEHAQPVLDGADLIEAQAAVGERIGRDVENAHDERALAEEISARGREAGGCSACGS